MNNIKKIQKILKNKRSFGERKPGGSGEKGVVIQRGNRGDKSIDMYSKASPHCEMYKAVVVVLL